MFDSSGTAVTRNNAGRHRGHGQFISIRCYPAVFRVASFPSFGFHTAAWSGWVCLEVAMSPFKGTATIKPPALPEVTYSAPYSSKTRN